MLPARVVGDVQVVGTGGIDAELVAPSPDGRSVFVWDPSTLAITRVDLATGSTTIGHGTTGTAAAATGPLAALGGWLAPTAAAKSVLRGGVVVSPDGTRVYAIGVQATAGVGGPSGSSGVFAFDATTLARSRTTTRPRTSSRIAVSRRWPVRVRSRPARGRRIGRGQREPGLDHGVLDGRRERPADRRRARTEHADVPVADPRPAVDSSWATRFPRVDVLEVRGEPSREGHEEGRQEARRQEGDDQEVVPSSAGSRSTRQQHEGGHRGPLPRVSRRPRSSARSPAARAPNRAPRRSPLTARTPGPSVGRLVDPARA